MSSPNCFFPLVIGFLKGGVNHSTRLLLFFLFWIPNCSSHQSITYGRAWNFLHIWIEKLAYGCSIDHVFDLLCSYSSGFTNQNFDMSDESPGGNTGRIGDGSQVCRIDEWCCYSRILGRGSDSSRSQEELLLLLILSAVLWCRYWPGEKHWNNESTEDFHFHSLSFFGSLVVDWKMKTSFEQQEKKIAESWHCTL